MGSSVVRAQTLGDTVGCPNCLEPRLGEFNPAAYEVMDYALAAAPRHGQKLILEFHGDSRSIPGATTTDAVFSSWRGGANFFTDPQVIADFKNHISNILNHVNAYTGLAYKDDPAIAGWMNCNGCGFVASMKGMSGAQGTAWVKDIADYVKSVDSRHVFMDNSLWPDVGIGSEFFDIPSVDVYAAMVYPHWSALFPPGTALPDRETGAAPSVHAAAARAVQAGKVWMMSEFGWDRTNWTTPAALTTFIRDAEHDPNIAADLFWALESHDNGHGWKPLPADVRCTPGADDTKPPPSSTPNDPSGCNTNEDGNWWAFYYTGISTLSHDAADMASRAQLLRAHGYAMGGFSAVPAHDIPPAPTASLAGTRLYWQGSAGASRYTIQRASAASGPWTTVCDRCVSDSDDGWVDANAPDSAWYHVLPVNLDGVAGLASPPVEIRIR